MMRILVAGALIALSMMAPAVAGPNAADRPPEPASARFAQLLATLKQHPEVAAYAAKAEGLDHYAEGMLGLPDPMLFIQQQDYPLGSSSSQDFEQKMIGLKQEIPAFGTRSAKSAKTASEAQKTTLAGAYAFAALKAKLIATLAARQSVREQEALLGAQANLFTSEASSIKGRIAANQAGLSQLAMSQAENAQADILRAELVERRHELEATLRNLVGEVPDVAAPLPALAVWDHDPERTYPVSIAAQDITMARQELALRDAEFGPHFEVQAGYGRMHNGDHAGTLMVGMSLPLWASSSQRPNANGAKAALHASELDRDMIRRETVQRLEHLQAQITASAEKIHLWQIKATALQTAAQAITRDYQAGKADLASYLKTRRDVLSVRMALAEEQARRVALIADHNRYVIEGESP